MRKSTRFLPLLLLTLPLHGCSSLEVSSQKDPDVRLAEYKTFAWAPALPASPDLARAGAGTGEIADKKIRKLVEAELQEAGLRQVAPDENPDFLVYYYADIENKTSVSNGGVTVGVGLGRYPGYVGYSAPVGGSVHEYEEGKLTLDFVDPESKQNFWRGFATDSLEAPGKNDEKARVAIAQMISRFENQRNQETKG